MEAAMATKITVALEDDLDGGPADETVRFGLGDVHYEIDLNKKNARAFRKKLAPFIEHARKAGPGQRRGPARTASSRQRSADIRAWAKATGLAVSDRGRIPASVADQYEAATRRSLRTPRHRRHEPICSGCPWPRAVGQQRATGPSGLPAHAEQRTLKPRIVVRRSTYPVSDESGLSIPTHGQDARRAPTRLVAWPGSWKGGRAPIILFCGFAA
jgi:nucleoid-associated protein Lsr2